LKTSGFRIIIPERLNYGFWKNRIPTRDLQTRRALFKASYKVSLSFNSGSMEVDPNNSGAFGAPTEEMALGPGPGACTPPKVSRARLRRRGKIQLVADEAFDRWKKIAALDGSFLQPLRRPWRLRYERTGEEPDFVPRRRELVFKAGVFKSAARLRLWLWGGLLFAYGVFRLWLHRSNTAEKRGVLLRETFTAMGPTFIKLGQQLSMRLDLLPYAYTVELEKLLDELDPFPTAEALDAIGRAIGEKSGTAPRPSEAVFSAFDSEPIGSASVACVYHAVLKTGENVAVKVRRPGVGVLLAADMRALKWLMVLAEICFLNPGFLRHFNHELSEMLMDELDFRKEARFAELYRRKMRKTKQMRFVSVPRVFFDYSNDEVMVSEFVSGIWLKDILAALITNEGEMLILLNKMNIDPVILSRRIQLIARFNNFENIFFHADLHPGNILVQPGNKICLIDFGSCGSFSRRELNAWRRWFDAQSVDDVGGMVQAAMAIIEPLPPIDKDEFGQRLESEFWKNLYAIKSKHTEWYERISSQLWMDFLRLCHEFKIPMRLNTLRMIRASMLTDTIAGRLDHDQDPYREFRHYEKGAGKRAKKRVVKRVQNLFGPSKFIRLEQGVETVLQTAFQVQRLINSLSGIRIGAIVTKLNYFLKLWIQHLAWIVLTAVVGTVAVWLIEQLRPNSFDAAFQYYPRIVGRFGVYPVGTLFGAFLRVVTNGWWLIIAFLPTFLVLFRVWFRLDEKEYQRGSGAIDDN
jgi:ubiquinone biosynthesis protein